MPFGRPSMTDYMWKCEVPGCNWTTYFWKRNPKEMNANLVCFAVALHPRWGRHIG
jgi:hypothetical protein